MDGLYEVFGITGECRGDGPSSHGSARPVKSGPVMYNKKRLCAVGGLTIQFKLLISNNYLLFKT